MSILHAPCFHLLFLILLPPFSLSLSPLFVFFNFSSKVTSSGSRLSSSPPKEFRCEMYRDQTFLSCLLLLANSPWVLFLAERKEDGKKERRPGRNPFSPGFSLDQGVPSTTIRHASRGFSRLSYKRTYIVSRVSDFFFQVKLGIERMKKRKRKERRKKLIVKFCSRYSRFTSPPSRDKLPELWIRQVSCDRE